MDSNTTTQNQMSEQDQQWLAAYRQKEEDRKAKRRADRVRRRVKLLAYEKEYRARPENKLRIKAKNDKAAASTKARVASERARYQELLRIEASVNSGVAA